MTMQSIKEPASNISFIGGASLILAALVKSSLIGFSDELQELFLLGVPFLAALLAEIYKAVKRKISRIRAKKFLLELKATAKGVLEDDFASSDAKQKAQSRYDQYCVLEMSPKVDIQIIEGSKD